MSKFVGIGRNKNKTVHMDYALEYAMAMSKLDKLEQINVLRWYADQHPESTAQNFDEVCADINADQDKQIEFIDWWFSGNWIYYSEEDELDAAD